tara:strand:- start:178 stop:405 length:228 start_codon:yes stop_codon:yes gene_type:complete
MLRRLSAGLLANFAIYTPLAAAAEKQVDQIGDVLIEFVDLNRICGLVISDAVIKLADGILSQPCCRQLHLLLLHE